MTYTRPSKLLSSLGALKKLAHNTRSFQAVAADGDRLQMFFICDGTETRLEIATRSSNDHGIFDLYVNGVLDSNGYDCYAAAAAETNREITLTQPVVKGLNTIELRVNGKNGASSNYYIGVNGASLQ